MTDEQLLRYSRQIMLGEFDVGGQQALLDANALVIGLGGLGSPVALYLAAAGVGRLTLVDHDTVDLSNLQRQIVHDHAALGPPKVESAAARIAALNPDTRVTTIAARLEGCELHDAVAEADVVLDGTDNFTSRYAINAACVAAKKPPGVRGRDSPGGPDHGHRPATRRRPLLPLPIRRRRRRGVNCAENGVAAPLVGIVGSVQAMEAMKIIAGVGESLAGYVLHLDAKRMEWRKLKLTRDPDCPTCKAGAIRS